MLAEGRTTTRYSAQRRRQRLWMMAQVFRVKSELQMGVAAQPTILQKNYWSPSA